MQLADVFKEDLVFLDFKAENKDEAIDKFVTAIEKAGMVDDPLALKNALVEREKLGTTGIGNGIAIPHARATTVKDLTVAFFQSLEGVGFDAIDGKPVNLIFVLLSPISSGGPYLKLLAKVSKLLRSDEFRGDLMEAKDSKTVLQIIQENE